MIEITRDNYELYALDYIEGDLPMDVQIKFEVFLSNNKDIAEELAELPDFNPDMNAKFKTIDALNLKKGALLSEEINPENCDYYFSAYHEGDLNLSEKQKVDDFLAMNPTLKSDFKQIGLLKFTVDESIHYPFKKELKKAIILPLWRRFARVAAVFLLLLSVAIAYFNRQSKPQAYVEREQQRSLMPIEKEEQHLPLKQSKEGGIKNEKGFVLSELAQVAKDKQHHPSKQSKEGELKNEEGFELSDLTQEAKDEQSESSMEDEFKADANEIETVIPEEQKYAEDDATIASIHEEEHNLSSNTILKFKKPRLKKSGNNAEVLASNHEETLITIANPLKKRSKKGFSFGPLKVKRSGSN